MTTTPGGDDTRELNKEPLNITIPASLKRRLEQYCEDSGLSQAAAVRVALSQYLNKAGYPREAR
jgi:antitoxin component of RelBE/YafQ-DinJ toxin-antitoxin module